MTGTAQDVDRSIWREIGAPLVAGSGAGPLAGETVAVKDLYAVAGHRIGAGNPTFLAEAPVRTEHAPAVRMLLDAGADVVGIAQTDEFAYSIAGNNPHSGPPPNGAVPGALPGGSSSGPASAVALGLATIGLGTDTAGSIRVPASYQGLWGLRPTHGAVPLDGVWPLAPRYDTVGWLTRSGELLRRVAAVALGDGGTVPGGFVVAPGLLDVVEDDVRAAFLAAVGGLGASRSGSDPFAAGAGDVERVELGDPDAMFETFRVTQAAEAWRSDGAWLTAHPDAVGPGVRERLAAAATISADEESAALADAAAHRARLDDVLGDRVLLLPSASSAAPPIAAPPARIDAVRGATLRLCCIAGLTGRPALGIPALTTRDGPVGLCLVGPRGSDLALLDLALRFQEMVGLE